MGIGTTVNFQTFFLPLVQDSVMCFLLGMYIISIDLDDMILFASRIKNVFASGINFILWWIPSSELIRIRSSVWA